VAFDAADRVVLLLHDGELADVRAMAEAIGAQVVERRGGEAAPEWDVLVVSSRYARDDLLRGGREKSVRIAVLDRHARSLRSLVRRAGVDLVVRRPVHPTALRLLLLHALYRGPERRSRRVAVGAGVRFRIGLLRRRAGVLADLSMRGCQILSPQPVRVGQNIVVWIPDAANEGRSFAVRGVVVRTLETPSGERGFGVDFGKVGKSVAPLLKASVTAHVEGPTVCAPGLDVTQPLLGPPAAAAPADAESSNDPGETTANGYRVGGSGRRERVRAPIDFVGGIGGATGDGADRRGAARHSYVGRRVVALDEEAARVLIGRDLSVGGMRVDHAPNLAVGQRLQIAIHVAAGQTPLVVQAEIVRDDGSRGFAMRFVDLDDAASRYLGKMVDSLPVVGSAGRGVVVTEIVRSDE
jgi:hypothetical protein